MTGRHVVDLEAPAKLTRSLRVVGRRADGYHLIDAEMVTLDLADRLSVSVGDGLTVTGSDGRPVDVGPHGSNLVERALRLAGRRAHVDIVKHIPAGAGLGGGSADAAAVLRWAGVGDLGVAAGIGADVAFCLAGGRARVRGIGERIERLPEVRGVVTLLTPPIHCDTAGVYRRWDELGGPVGDNGNDLEPAAVDLYPDLIGWRDRLGEAAGVEPRLAGSGSTWFVDGECRAALAFGATVARFG